MTASATTLLPTGVAQSAADAVNEKVSVTKTAATSKPLITCPPRVEETVEDAKVRRVKLEAHAGLRLTASGPSGGGYDAGRMTLPSSASPKPGLCSISHTCPSRSRKPPAYPP